MGRGGSAVELLGIEGYPNKDLRETVDEGVESRTGSGLASLKPGQCTGDNWGDVIQLIHTAKIGAEIGQKRHAGALQDS